MIISLSTKLHGIWKHYLRMVRRSKMMTTDDSNISEQDENYIDNPENDNGKTQAQIDQETQERLAKDTSNKQINKLKSNGKVGDVSSN